jgi:hypothetical protein
VGALDPDSRKLVVLDEDVLALANFIPSHLVFGFDRLTGFVTNWRLRGLPVDLLRTWKETVSAGHA